MKILVKQSNKNICKNIGVIKIRQNMYNGVPSFDNLNRMKQQYQAIHQQNSSYRESLLVSPHCSKYQKHSPRYLKIQDNNSGLQNSLLEYIRPFESQQLNKTQTKPKLRKKPNENHNRKTTQPDYEQKNILGTSTDHNNGQKSVTELKIIIKQKDQKIKYLQKALSQLTYKKFNQTISGAKYNKNISIQQLNERSFSKRDRSGIIQKTSEESFRKQNTMYLETQIQNYKKQIKFLTHNNQQLFESLQRINEHCDKLKRILNKTILYNRQLQQKLKQVTDKSDTLEELNHHLIQQKRQMMENYQEELHLFRKMKKVWEDQNRRQKDDDDIKSVMKSKSKDKTRATSVVKPKRSESAKLKTRNQ